MNRLSRLYFRAIRLPLEGPLAVALRAGKLDQAKSLVSIQSFEVGNLRKLDGQVLLEAQASGLPVVAVGEGGPASIVVDRVTGRLCPPDATPDVSRAA